MGSPPAGVFHWQRGYAAVHEGWSLPMSSHRFSSQCVPTHWHWGWIEHMPWSVLHEQLWHGAVLGRHFIAVGSQSHRSPAAMHIAGSLPKLSQLSSLQCVPSHLHCVDREQVTRSVPQAQPVHATALWLHLSLA